MVYEIIDVLRKRIETQQKLISALEELAERKEQHIKELEIDLRMLKAKLHREKKRNKLNRRECHLVRLE